MELFAPDIYKYTALFVKCQYKKQKKYIKFAFIQFYPVNCTELLQSGSLKNVDYKKW